jgi:hypothetical protein
MKSFIRASTYTFVCLFPSLFGIACHNKVTATTPARTTAAISQGDLRSRMYLIADDSMRGRAAGAVENFMMTSYLAREAERFGLEPGGENGTYFQVIPMIRRWADSSSTLRVDGQPLALFSDFALIRPTSTLQFATRLAPASLQAVYGGRAGDTEIALSEDAVRGRLLIFDAPLGTNGQPTSVYNTAAAIAISRYPSAAAIAISALDIVTSQSLASLKNSGGGLSQLTSTRANLPFGLVISSSAASRIMGAPLSTLQPGARGKTVDVNVRFAESAVAAPARNVIAILRGSDPALRGQYVAIGAHSDHIAPAARAVDHDSLRAYNMVIRPYGADSRVAQTTPVTAQQWARVRTILDSLRRLRPPRPDSIYNGADDDGSGSVALLEIAESMAAGRRPRRSVLFVWHTGEEAGLLGSAWFTSHTTVPHDSITAEINMDMVGRGMKSDTPSGGPGNIQVIGSRRLSTDLGNVVDSVNGKSRDPYSIDYTYDAPRQVQMRYCRSDHYMYARSGIPIAYISRGYHPDYHMLTDEPEYINYPGLARVAAFVRDIALGVANRNDRVRVDKPKPDPLAPCIQ